MIKFLHTFLWKLSIRDCVTKATEELGYSSTKQEQLDVAIAFVDGRDVLPFF